MIRLTALALVAMATTAQAGPVVPVPTPKPSLLQARTVCKERAEMVKILQRKFGEVQRSFGLQNDRRVLELYASPDGTWTAILSMPNGKSCVVAAGEAWTVLPPAPVGDPA